MASLLDVASAYSPCGQVFRFLELRDLPQLQAAHTLLRAALAESAAWWEGAQRSLPSFKVSEELFDRPQRAQVLALLPPLLAASAEEGLFVTLSNMDQVKKLSKQLALAQKVTRTHLAKGGAMAHAMLARLVFPENDAEAALQRNLGPGELDQALPVSLGTPIECPGTKGPLRVHVALRNGGLLLGARDDCAASSQVRLRDPLAYVWEAESTPADGKCVTIDVASVSPELLLHYRSVGVYLNGTWESTASGMLSASKGRKAASRALADGVLCVLAVRDGLPENTGSLAHTLHLDTVRR